MAALSYFVRNIVTAATLIAVANVLFWFVDGSHVLLYIGGDFELETANRTRVLLLDIFTRRKHLDCQAKQIEKIAQTNRELIRTERMNEPGTELKIEALKNEIKNQEQKLWALHKEAYQQRVQQA